MNANDMKYPQNWNLILGVFQYGEVQRFFQKNECAGIVTGVTELLGDKKNWPG